MTDQPIFVATLHRPGVIVGGIQSHIKAFRKYCSGSGIRTVLISPFHAPKWIVYPMFGIRRLLKGSWNARWHDYTHGRLLLRELKRQMDSGSRNFIYAQDPISAKAALQLKSLGWNVHITLAVHFNVSIADEWAGKGYLSKGDFTYCQMLIRDNDVLRAVDQIIFVSDYARDEVNRRVKDLDGRKQRVVFNSIYSASGTSNHGGQECIGDLISIGGFEPRKNQQFILRVLAAARDFGFAYKLTLVGAGPLQRSLQQLAQSLGVAHLVSFVGAVSGAAPLIDTHRAYVHAALMENLPIVIIEALAAGKPVFAAPVGGIPELFCDGVEGKTWNFDDPKMAAAALIGVLENSEMYAAMSKAARKRYEALFTPEATQPRLLAAVLGGMDAPECQAERVAEDDSSVVRYRHATS